jgi:putative membrane protein
MRRFYVVAAAVALAAPWIARAQEAKAPVNDRLFVAAAAAGNSAEVAAARLALQRAGGDEVKKFAQKLIDDHNKANQELMSLAGTKRIAVPTTLDVKDQAAIDCLSGLSGADFDREFLTHQVAAHTCAVQLFQAESARGRDADLKAFASKTLPTLQDHLKSARSMMKDEGAPREGDREPPK